MMKNKKIPTYLDGFALVYRPKVEENKSYFGAKVNIKKIDEMETLFKLAYSQCSKRLQDMEFAESSGRELTLKIKTRLVQGIKNTDKVVIDGTLYDIIYIDEDRINRELYLYLEENRTVINNE
jgi:SPP1 family predicted phage head-tail adaptor